MNFVSEGEQVVETETLTELRELSLPRWSGNAGGGEIAQFMKVEK